MAELSDQQAAALGHRRQNLGWATAYELTVLATSTATFFLVSKQLGPSGYGDYAAIQAIIVTVSALVNGWISFVLIERVIREHWDLNAVISRLLPLVIAAASVGLFVSWLVATVLMPRVGGLTLVSFLLAALLGNTLLTLGSSSLQAVQGFASAARFRLVGRFTQFGAILVLWLARDLSLESLSYATLFAGLVSGFVALFWAMAFSGLRLRIDLSTRIPLARAIAYALTLLAFAAEEDGDKILLLALTSSTVTGIYAAGYRVVQLGLVPLRAAISALHNEFVTHRNDRIGQHVHKSIRFTLIAALYGLVVTIALFLLSSVIPHFLGARYRPSIEAVRLLSPLVVLRCLSSFAFNGLMGLGHRFWRLGVLGCCAVVNVGLNVALIPILSWRGSALALLASEALYVVLAWLALVRLERRADEARDGGAPLSNVCD